ncbi:MAG: hypothetical protein OEY22_05880 [Candidatus Bathyarchaeota archaeon]|nr:hypothetical protein [Candidatus Bathyarchaeota archaeon]MDH5787015.1 hypothetical protein [Candidatus Bathyarchaeota archaeon]
MTTSKIARILELLSNEQWYTLKEIQHEIKLNENQILQIIRFLEEYNFIVVDEANKTIRIEGNVRRFLATNITS